MARSKLLLLVAVCLSVLAAGCGKQVKWYDFGNGKINLENVSVIRPRMTCVLDLSTTKIDDLGGGYPVPMTDERMQKILATLTYEEISRQESYRIKFTTYIMLDDFQLTLYESEEYVKHLDGGESNNLLDEESLEELRDGLESSLETYKEITGR